MPYTNFHDYFPQIAEAEARWFRVGSHPTVPPGVYGLAELYCDEPRCDCRRVMLTVISREFRREEAVIAFGWEPREFYEGWLGGRRVPADRFDANHMKGPVLNLMSPQSSFAPALLELVTELCLEDLEYVARLRRHYRMFRERIDRPQVRTGRPTGPPPKRPRPRRR